MAARSRHPEGGAKYDRSRTHRHFDEQPSIETAIGAAVRLRDAGDELVVELLDVDGWKELKRWSR